MSPRFGEQSGDRRVWSCADIRAKPLKDRRYRERAAYLRRLAKEAQTEALRQSCLKQAETYEAMAREDADAVGQE
jgi:hypothetical protein